MTAAGVTILGSDTEVGKTFHSCRLLDALKRRAGKLGVYKPVSSGFSIESPESDPQQLLAACGEDWDVRDVCPQAFSAALAPPVAATLEDCESSWETVREGLEKWKHRADFVLVEAAGGVLSPITFEHTSRDLAAEAGFPIVLVVANRLGCVNHCLMSVETLQARSLSVACILLNTLPGMTADESTASNRSLLSKFSDVPIVSSGELCVELLQN